MPTAALVLFVALIALGVSKLLARRRLPLPPGPRGWPILGNFFDMPNDFEWYYWAKFKDLYGPVSSASVLGKTIILLNDLPSCLDVLEKNSSQSSGRPYMPFAGEIVGWDQQLLLVPYNKHFKAMRKLAHTLVGTKAAAAKYAEVQETECKYFVLRMAEEPNTLIKNLRTTIGAILLRMSHGYITRIDGQDPFINLIELAARDFYQATKPGKWLVDLFPSLKHIPSWLPGAGFKRTGAQYRAINEEQTDRPFEFVLKAMDNGTALPSFVRSALENEKLSKDERYALKFCAAAMYGGGLDTMTGATSTFFLLMVLYPEVQRRVQAELDAVVGTHRLPTISDRDKLPYLNAVQREIYRWGAIVPLGIPHCATEDIQYQGYHIPKGSLLINNIWKIAHDEDIYTDPFSFKPERFMGPDPELDPETFVFGFGRRKCPGIEVAHATIFLMMASALSVFSFDHPVDSKTGTRVLLKEEFLAGSVIHPKPFTCSIELRSDAAKAVVNTLKAELALVDRTPSKV